MLLLNRFAPGWQKNVPAKYAFLYDILKDRLALGEKEIAAVRERLSARYGYDVLYAKHNSPIEARDDAFKAYDGQTGRAFYIDFKPTGEFPHPADMGTAGFTKNFPFDKGMVRTVYPQGFKSMVIKEVTIEGKGRPLETTDLYKVGYIDATGAGYRISASKVENNVYTDAVVETDGFTLKAPKVELKEKNGTLTIVIVSKVKAG